MIPFLLVHGDEGSLSCLLALGPACEGEQQMFVEWIHIWLCALAIVWSRGPQFSLLEVHQDGSLPESFQAGLPNYDLVGQRKEARIHVFNKYPDGLGCQLPSDRIHWGKKSAFGDVAFQNLRGKASPNQLSLLPVSISAQACSGDHHPSPALLLNLSKVHSCGFCSLTVEESTCCRSDSCCSSGTTWEQHDQISALGLTLGLYKFTGGWGTLCLLVWFRWTF